MKSTFQRRCLDDDLLGRFPSDDLLLMMHNLIEHLLGLRKGR